MTDRVYSVLFLCTGNTARFILAERVLDKDGGGRFRVFSAGSHPKGVVNPFALKVLQSYGYPTEGARSKSWDEFSGADAPEMDFVFTVCDNAAAPRRWSRFAAARKFSISLTRQPATARFARKLDRENDAAAMRCEEST